MNIMVLSGQRWSNTNSLGNTLSNLFDDWPDEDIFSNIYFRAGNPSNLVCKEGFQILSQDILRNLITPGKIGCIKETVLEKEQETGDVTREQAFISFLHKTGMKPVYHFNNLLWKMGKWKNGKLNSYINSHKPDVIFGFAIGVEDNYQLIKYVKDYTGAKLVLFILDDIIGDEGKKLDSLGRRQRKNAIDIINQADLLYAISEPMRQMYERRFSRPIGILHKGAEIDSYIKEEINTPIRMVYAGNLLYGRKDTLHELAKNIGQINLEKERIHFDLYSTTPLDKETKDCFAPYQGIELHGIRPYSEIKEIMRESDIVLHVESFEEESKRYVKYSFSTKIVDCLQSGSVIFGIGPRDIASMEYLENVPGAITVYDNEKILDTLKQIVENPRQLILRAAQSRDFAQKNVDINVIRKKLSEDLHALVEQSGGV